jgi:hypothetical protein
VDLDFTCAGVDEQDDVLPNDPDRHAAPRFSRHPPPPHRSPRTASSPALKLLHERSRERRPAGFEFAIAPRTSRTRRC